MNKLRRSLSLGGAGFEAKEQEEYDNTYCSQPNTPLSRTLSFSSNNHKEDGDMELLESGGAREVIVPRDLEPAHPRLKKLNKYHVVREDKKKFWLYCESTNDFVLSAVMANSCFYISKYENFPNSFSKKQPSGFVAVVRLDPKTKAFKLFSRFCEGCDDVLGLHTCGKGELVNGDRQLLMELSHMTHPVHCGHDSVIDCNVVKTKLPMVYDDLSRDCWCARFGKKSVPPADGSSTPKLGTAVFGTGRSKPAAKCDDCGAEQSSSTAERCEGGSVEHPRVLGLKGRARAFSAPPAPPAPHAEPSVLAGDATRGECVLTTRKPRFDRSTGSLRMKFLNNRVKMASSKNLIFCLDKNSDKGTPQAEDSESIPNEERVVCQFGKVSEDKFNMDFRFPLSALQAFAMCLTLFKWQAGEN